MYYSGQFYHHKVRISPAYKKLYLADGKVVHVEEGSVWDTVEEKEYTGKKCWHPVEGESAIQGQSWEYVVDHIMATRYKHSLFSKYKK